MNGKGRACRTDKCIGRAARRRSWMARKFPVAGNLYYRGYNIKDLVKGFLEAKTILDLKRSHICFCLENCPPEQQLEDFSGDARGADGRFRQILCGM